MNQDPQGPPNPFQHKRLIDLNLIDYVKRARVSPDGTKVWDPVRRKWLVRLPEELVRLALIFYFNDTYKISFNRMAVERQISSDSLRMDLAIYDSKGTVHLLVECKAPEIPLSNDHIIQIGRYNESMHARFVMITNGLQCIAMDLTKGEILEKLSMCFESYS